MQARTIGRAEYVGEAAVIDGTVNVGGVLVTGWTVDNGNGPEPFTGTLSVYVRRMTDNGQAAEVALAIHDGPAEEADA